MKAEGPLIPEGTKMVALYTETESLTKAERKAREDAILNTLFETIHVSKKGHHFPMLAFYAGGSGRVEIPVAFMSMLKITKKTRIALTLVVDAASLEAAKRKGVMEELPMIVISIKGVGK